MSLRSFFNFRRTLRQELTRWEEEGLVSREQAFNIESRYRLSEISAESRIGLTQVIFFIGVLLIGLGVITFIAAHWEWVPRWLKLVLIVGAMLASQGAGYIFWKVKGSYPGLGHALIFLGTLIFGANIGLIAQIFHIHHHSYNAFFAWSAGTIPMAYLFCSVPHALLGILTSFFWFAGWTFDRSSSFLIYPYFVGLFLIPLSYRCESRFVHFTALIAFSVSCSMIGAFPDMGLRASLLMSVGIVLLFWTFGDLHRLSERLNGMANLGRSLSLIGLAIMIYLLSFHFMFGSGSDLYKGMNEGPWVILTLSVYIASLILGMIIFAQGRPKGHLAVLYGVILCSCFLVILVTFLPVGQIAGTLLMNAVAFSLGAVVMGLSIAKYRRSLFWLSLFYLLLLIMSRFFEYETGLLLKSLAFIGAGIVLIYGGVRFEAFLAKEAINRCTSTRLL